MVQNQQRQRILQEVYLEIILLAAAEQEEGLPVEDLEIIQGGQEGLNTPEQRVVTTQELKISGLIQVIMETYQRTERPLEKVQTEYWIINPDFPQGVQHNNFTIF